jgi:hypothetical protein
VKNRTLFKKRRHSHTDPAGHTHVFTVVVAQGDNLLPVESDRLTFTDHVEVRTYQAVVNEVVMDVKGEFIYTHDYEFENLCSRSNHANYFLAKVKSCRSAKELMELVEDLRVDFNISLRADTRKALRKLLGLPRNVYENNMVSSRKKFSSPLDIKEHKAGRSNR